MARRPLAVVAGAVALAGLVVSAGSGGAGAEVATGAGSARSQAAEATQGSPLQLSTSVRALGGLLDLSPLTSGVVTPLVNALTALPTGITSGLASALVGTGLRADSGTTQQPRPASGYPTCGQRGWTSSTCYGPVAPAVAAPPALTLSTGAVQGYATGDARGYVAEARVADPVLTLLGFPLGDLGVVSSSASCGTDPSGCRATQSLSGSSLLGGALSLSLADGTTVAKLNGAAVPATGTALTVGGLSTRVAVDGNLVTITVQLGLTGLLSALGLPNLLSATGGLGVLTDDGTTATLTVTVGPGQLAATSPASAWGLQVSADLAVAVKLKLLSVLGAGLASVAVTSGGTPPSLVRLKLAYSTATSGTLLPGWVPAAVV